MMGIDVSTIGNHEFDYTWRGVEGFLKLARFETVSANLVDARGQLMTARPYTIREVNGIRLAIIGAVTAELPTLTTPRLLGEWHALPVLETVRRYIAEVQDKSDVIVVLGHVDSPEEDELLAQAPQVAVVVAGHLHDGMPVAKSMDGRLVVRVKAYGAELGRLDLDVDLQKKGIVKSAWTHLDVDANRIQPAPDVAKVVAEWEAKVSKIVDVPIGKSEREISSRDLKALIERAMSGEMHTDFAFMNQGGVRDFLPKGTILARNVWNVMPFDNHVVVGRFKGSQLPRRVTNGQTVDPDREYTLAVSDFTAANQKTDLGVQGLAFPKIGPLQRDVIISWIKKQKVLQ
jgi:2',3'-cyclic-nucleotide 2'-phosphodiesterase (5'-nucleotidase family)